MNHLAGRQKWRPYLYAYDSTKRSGKGDFLEKHLVSHACLYSGWAKVETRKDE
jgi:hypothetical protein